MNEAIKILNDLAFDEKLKKYPDQPYLVKPKFSDKSANALTKAIIAFVRLNGWQAERISNTGRVMDGRKETADISATIAGKSVKIEVKHSRDRQSDAQKRHQADVERSGCIYCIAHDFESFHRWYGENFTGQ